MNVFVPCQSPIECAKALWNDKKRFNKQIIECRQILDAIDGRKAWRNHPVCLMYQEHKEWLQDYLNCFRYYRDYKNGFIASTIAQNFSYRADSMRPPFLTEEFCNQHKRRLFTKSPNLYPQFAEYGTSEVNWYVINGEIVKYKDGKRIKE